MQKVRVGMIGTGGIANWHGTNLKQIPEVDIVAIADISEQNRDNFAAKFELDSVRKFTDYRDMLEQMNLDAVVICSPHTLHFEQVKDALNSGCHVLVEKPMTCTSSEAEQLIATSERTGKVLQVSYQRHCEPEFIYIKKAIADGLIGEITSVSASLYQNWKEMTKGTWRQNPALSGGGMLMDSGSHIVDMLLWTTGLTPVQAQSQLHLHETPVEIDSFSSIRFAEGPIASLTVVGSTQLSWLEQYIFCGTKGSIIYECQSFHEKKVLLYKDPNTPIVPELPPITTNQDKSFIDAILGRSEVLIPGTFGLDVVKLTEMIYKAGGYEPMPTRRPNV